MTRIQSASIALALLLAPPSLGQVAPPAAPPTAETDAFAWPTFVPRDLGARVARLLARSPEGLPEVELADVPDFAAALQGDMLAVRRIEAADEQAPALTQSEEEAIRFAAERTAAMYSHSSGRILVRPKPLDDLIAGGVVPRAHRDRLLGLALANEFARFVQDRELRASGSSLAAFLGAGGAGPIPGTRPSRETLAIRQAVSEGQAALVRELLAAELGRDDVAWLAAKAVADALSPAALPGDGTWPATRRAIVYRGGVLWARDAHAKGGIAATWELFRTPPKDLARLDLDAPNHDPAISDRLAAAIGSGRIALGQSWTGVPRPSQPSTTLAPQLAYLDPMARARLLAACRGVASLAAVEPKGGRAALLLFRSTPGDGGILWQELGVMNERAIRGLGVREPQRETRGEDDFEFESLLGAIGADTTLVPVLFLRARRGDVVVQASFIQSAWPDDELILMAKRLLELGK